MKTMSVGEFKSRFSEVMRAMREGEEIAVCYGKKHETIGVLVPFRKYARGKRRIGLLKGKASCRLGKGFKMTDEDFLAS